MHHRPGSFGPEALAVLTRELSTEETGDNLKLLADAARLAVLLGDSRTTDAIVSQAEAVARALDVPHRRAILEHCRGLSDNDPGLLLTAADQYQKAGRPLPRAQALEAAGMALAANGDTADATVALSSAVTVYSELGADWDLARTRTALHASG